LDEGGSRATAGKEAPSEIQAIKFEPPHVGYYEVRGAGKEGKREKGRQVCSHFLLAKIANSKDKFFHHGRPFFVN
jgi:hypothetical protein